MECHGDPNMNKPEDELARPERKLSLWDCTAILVGIIIGSGIYESSGLVAAQAANTTELATLWIAGAVFSLLGALCYAELATRYPEEGGDYVYLTQAFGRPVGFLFAWTQLWIIRPGSIGAMACVFATYADRLLPLGEHSFLLYACGSISVLTAINVLGVQQGRVTQNVLSIAKILGIAGLIVGGLSAGDEHRREAAPGGDGSLSLALIFVLFAYTGWNEMGCVAAEVRDPRRNIFRALLLGTTIVAVAYLGINAACGNVLGLGGLQVNSALPAVTAQALWGDAGAKAISLLICISTLGSTNGMIFTGARIYYAMGKKHRLFAPLAAWSPRFGTPIVSLLLQSAVTLGLVIGFSQASAAEEARTAFQRLVIFMTPPFYLFLIGSALAVIVFRRKQPAREGVYRMPLFPLPPLVVAAASAFMLYRGIDYVLFNYREQGSELAWPAAWVACTIVSGLLLSAVDRNPSPLAGEGSRRPDEG